MWDCGTSNHFLPRGRRLFVERFARLRLVRFRVVVRRRLGFRLRRRRVRRLPPNSWVVNLDMSCISTPFWSELACSRSLALSAANFLRSFSRSAAICSSLRATRESASLSPIFSAFLITANSFAYFFSYVSPYDIGYSIHAHKKKAFAFFLWFYLTYSFPSAWTTSLCWALRAATFGSLPRRRSTTTRFLFAPTRAPATAQNVTSWSYPIWIFFTRIYSTLL